MDNPAPLHEKYRLWLLKMREVHEARGIKGNRLAPALGVPVETLYRVTSGERPGFFNSESLECMEKATGIPAWVLLQCIQQGRVIELLQSAPAAVQKK